MLSKPLQIQGGQSVCQKVTSENGKELFVKQFLSQADYQQEKQVYLALNELTSNVKLSVLKMIQFDDYSCSIIFPFIKFELSRICSQVKKNGARGMKWIFALYHFTQVVWDIRKLHGLNLCHCDIKVNNILVDQLPNGLKDILIDFGHSIRIKQNELSDRVCGTEQYNPHELNEGIVKNKITPYSPYLLDLYQLGMLLLTLIVFIPISKAGKKLISLKKREKFLTLIQKQYLQTYGISLEMPSEVYDLIWSLLTGQINQVDLILDHKVYDLKEVQEMLKTLPCCEKSKANYFEQEEEEINFEHIYLQLKEGQMRSSGHINIDKEYTELLQSHCKYYDQFLNNNKLFCDKTPRKIKESELQANSLIFEIKTEQVMQHLLYCVGRNNPDIFDQDIFMETDGQILNFTLNYVTQEVIIDDSTDDDDDDDDDDETKVQSIDNEIQLQIEIVMLENQTQPTSKSIIFKYIKGKDIYYYNIIADIENELKNLI
ncbi:hypothetical protein ABPG74_014059 [Tetrahymena malaccensis]